MVSRIDAYVAKVLPMYTEGTYFNEVFNGIEFGADQEGFAQLKNALQKNKQKDIQTALERLKRNFARVHNKDYDHEVDRKVAKVLLPLYARSVSADALPAFYETIRTRFGGDYAAYVDALYDTSIFASQQNFDAFLARPTTEAIDADLAVAYSSAKADLRSHFTKLMQQENDAIRLLHKTYVRGLCEMYAPTPKAPDANFTIRLTYGNVKSYDPKDGVHYNYYTTLKGVMEKEDPTNPEFVVPARLKELYASKDFGRYALPNGEMPACFLTTNDITGGNSGSPVMNGNGELIGAAFDGNWESLSGDISFDNGLQRCIAVDIRYILFIVDKLGGCQHLIDEMTIR